MRITEEQSNASVRSFSAALESSTCQERESELLGIIGNLKIDTFEKSM